jgi:hypothetical protein
MRKPAPTIYPDIGSKIIIGEWVFETSSLLPRHRNIELFTVFVDTINSGIAGDVAEFGISKGQTLRAIARHLDRIGSDKIVYGFDWFRGLPHQTLDDAPGTTSSSQLSDEMVGWYGATRDKVENILEGVEAWGIIEGLIQDTGPEFKKPLCFAHINVDLYVGTKASLEVLGREMVLGGKAVFSGYGTELRGVTAAVDEFMEDHANWSIELGEGGIWLAILTRDS